MKASAIEFRLRMPIMVAIVVLGFYAPWIEWLSLGPRRPMLEWLPLELSRTGVLSFAVATPIVICIGAILALLGAIFRVWGAAYLNYATIHHGEMQGGAIMADGPYRFMRNPLYVGGWFMIAAAAFLMPPTGALVSFVLFTVFLLRLILAEEEFLGTSLGEPYRQYLCVVPRLMPKFRAGLPSSGQKPHWFTALIAEINPIGMFVTLAVLSWSYDYLLMLKGILISFGASLVVRALMRRESQNPA
jgi:protein-S-isoprenylcysteine O-methyltransferase Ste14